VLRLREVRRADGMRLVSDFPESTSNDKSPDQSTGDALSGTWLSIPDLQMSAKLTYSGSASLPSTPKGAAALRAFARELDPGEDCLPSTAPIAMIFPDIKRIDTDGPVIRVRTDHDGIERIVHMDVDSHDDSKPSLQGHSIGRWEGRVLIVDTQRFVDHATGNGYSLPSGQRKHLIERFELDPDGRSLTYRFELEDPEYLTAPVTGEAEWDYRPDLQPSPEQCAVEYARRFLSD
jgi:hypothetical protein